MTKPILIPVKESASHHSGVKELLEETGKEGQVSRGPELAFREREEIIHTDIVGCGKERDSRL